MIELKVGDKIRMNIPRQDTWDEGVVLSQEGNRKYKVKVQAGIYTRNRRQLILGGQSPTAEVEDEPEPEISRNGIRNRPQRNRRPPQRYGIDE